MNAAVNCERCGEEIDGIPVEVTLASGVSVLMHQGCVESYEANAGIEDDGEPVHDVLVHLNYSGPRDEEWVRATVRRALVLAGEDPDEWIAAVETI